MRWTSGLILGMVFLAFSLPGYGDSRDRIAARVNDEVITLDELEKVMRGNFDDPVYRRKVLQNLVIRRLFAQTAKKYEVGVTDDEVDAAIEKEKRRFETKEAFYKHIRDTYNLTHPEEEYSDEKKNTMMVQRLYYYLYRLGRLRPKNVEYMMNDFVSPAEVKEYYDKNREQFKEIDEALIMRIVLTYANPEQRAERLAEAESILRHVAEGSDFRLLAAYHSDVNRGKQMPPLRRSDPALSKDLKELVFDRMKEKEISGIIDDGDALNIIRLDARKYEKEQTYEEAQPRIIILLENQRRAENEKQLRDYLVSKAYLWPEDLFSR